MLLSNFCLFPITEDKTEILLQKLLPHIFETFCHSNPLGMAGAERSSTLLKVWRNSIMLDHNPAQFKDKFAVDNHYNKQGFRLVQYQNRTRISQMFGLFSSHPWNKYQYKVQKASYFLLLPFLILSFCGYSFQCQKDAGGCAGWSQQNLRNIYKNSVHRIISIKLLLNPTLASLGSSARTTDVA